METQTSAILWQEDILLWYATKTIGDNINTCTVIGVHNLDKDVPPGTGNI